MKCLFILRTLMLGLRGFTLICLFTLFAGPLFGLDKTVAESDTTVYKVVIYEVRKKSITVVELASLLKVDAAIIVKLNRFKSDKRTLFKGQKVKIPVYPKVVQEKKGGKKSGKKGDKVIPQVPAVQEEEKINRPYYDRENDNDRLLLVVAHRELNETMLEGVLATLDSFNIKEDKIVDERNLELTLQNMKRNRDRALLKPYIEHVRDSLTHEISLLKEEQKLLEERLKLTPPIAVRNDTVIAGIDTIVYFTAIYSDDRGTQKTVQEVKIGEEQLVSNRKKESARNESIKKGRDRQSPRVIDTVIVYDMPQVIPKQQFPEVREVPQPLEYTDTTMIGDTLVTTFKRDAIAMSDTSPESKDNPPREAVENKPYVYLSNADSIRRIKAEFFLKGSKKAFEERNFKNAETYLEKSLELYPSYYDAVFFRAQMEEVTGSLQESLKGYRQCEALDSSKYELYLAIGQVYMKMKRKTEAFQAFEKSISLNPENIPALVERAAILTDWKRYREAIRDYDTVLSINRVYHFAYKARGHVKILEKDFANAIDDFTRFIIFEESDPSAYYYRGLAKIGNNELVDGCMDLSTSAEMGYSAAEKAIKKSCE